MAKMNVCMMFFVVLFATSAWVVHTFAVDENEPKNLWDKCVVPISPKCALDIIDQVFGNGTVSDSCCRELVKEGKECHDTLIKYIANRPSLSASETKYLKKRDELWAQCVSVSKTVEMV
ncbi:unnamed protein product [Arabis nemorensis]|uniref:Prolamin-like domain-containing protein n=1 Tax=Arabis nemorensis TaxID=586526 RepID=A0A565CUG7_9BRAS|nr:unnamed protein product [Arabis nemorensis]